MDEERRSKPEPAPVTDRPMEVGIKLNNLLTALVIAVMMWVGTSVTQIKESLSELGIQFATASVKVEYIEEELKEQKASLQAHIDKHSILRKTNRP